ncbi:MAG: orotidine-5'-phosphate decarboxylase [Sutterellaceae bacterium]|nr:orotidine-5'-phosphate decarboxylase [Burkholderiaceae bacterium]MCX7901878.1 orotidine-5'-phosphate decarboxylase [Burkholderiaceae bacterium]MDW8430049.1 orotidine-5'-phosphate decarboxylase [Sutterellaceae bacterium]
MPTFVERLAARWHAAHSLLCVGLDPDPTRLPAALRGRDDAIFAFCRAIVDATADLVCAFKPQIAYFSAYRAEDQLEALIAHIRRQYPGILVILDAKRGDIGATAEQYAREAFERYTADAVTLSPYMGEDSLAPFLADAQHGAFLLCRTSNAGGDALQMLDVGGERLYERIARLALRWNRNGQLGLVVGATYPAELARVRALVGEMPLLVPGIGAQGGDVAATLSAGQTADGTGLVINSSRAILYAGQGEDFAAQARAAAVRLRDEINRLRRQPPLG